MPKKRQAKKSEAKRLHYERITLERVMEIAQAGVPKSTEAGSDSAVGEDAAKSDTEGRGQRNASKT